MKRKQLLLGLLTLLPVQASSQVPLSYYFPSTPAFDPKIPSPESYFGFQVGEWHLSPDQIHAYMNTLDQVSERITLTEYARSHEQRPLLLLTITSPGNHKNIHSIRSQHLALSDPERSASLNLESMPLVVWMGYSVHGNEPSGSNASVLVAYYLAAAQGPEIDRLLSETVILLNPSINPDGLNRFATWANMHKGSTPVSDPASREHNEAWPGGRTNHYWFDLNRDWMPVQHPESRGQIEHYYKWMPNILTDHHEMGTNATFFFQPGVPTRSNPLTPRRAQELTEAIAAYHSKALDQIGSLYYSEEVYDDFYIGKGSSYPDITGGIGILFEQASSRGHLQESIHGPLSFPAAIRNQVATSLSTLKAGQALRKDLLTYQREFFASALRDAGRSAVKAYIVGSNNDDARGPLFHDILRRHQIQTHELAKQVRVDGKLFEPGKAFVIPTSQRQYRLLTALFERLTAFEDSLFYDISAWSLPLAFDLPFAEIRNLDNAIVGAQIANASIRKGKLVGSFSHYAYVFEWDSYYAPRALYRFQKAGIKTKVATKPFTTMTADGQKEFGYGTILIPVGIQAEKKDTLRSLIEIAVQEDRIRLYALETGMSSGGIDLGSPSFQALEKPSVVLVVGSGVSFTDAGAVWHLLDHRFDIDVSLVEMQSLGRIDLDRYTIMAMAGGSYAAIDSAGKDALRRWIESGKTLIAMEQAAEWAVNTRLAAGKFRRDEPSRRDSLVQQKAYVLEPEYTGALSIPGTIFQIRYDRTHPLFYGYRDSLLSILRRNTLFLDPSKNPYASPGLYTERPLLAGYVHKQHDKHLRGSAAVVISGLRNGRVILMTDNPNFRAFWYGTTRLFLNSVFFGPIIRASSARATD